MEIKTIVVGFLKENCYIITKNRKSIIIDPGDEAFKIIEACKGKEVVGILLTHHHFDHIGALKEVEEYFQIKAENNVDGFAYEILKTPGHTSDSLTYYFYNDHVMFTGDFLFSGAIGRMDLPTGSKKEMMTSLEKIKNYPKDTILYPGHGEPTILGKEIPYFTNYLEDYNV